VFDKKFHFFKICVSIQFVPNIGQKVSYGVSDATRFQIVLSVMYRNNTTEPPCNCNSLRITNQCHIFYTHVISLNQHYKQISGMTHSTTVMLSCVSVVFCHARFGTKKATGYHNDNIICK